MNPSNFFNFIIRKGSDFNRCCKERVFSQKHNKISDLKSRIEREVTVIVPSMLSKVRVNFEKHGGDRCHNLKNGKEASEVTEGKSSRMRWGR